MRNKIIFTAIGFVVLAGIIAAAHTVDFTSIIRQVHGG